MPDTGETLRHVTLEKGPKMTKLQEFYSYVLKKLNAKRIPFLIAGTYALALHTGITRKTKDLDIFCKAGDAPRIIKAFEEDGYKSASDERWLFKIYKGKNFIDFIFNTVNGICAIDDTWFDGAPKVTLLGSQVQIPRVDDLVWNKSFRMDRLKFDGADLYHLILKKSNDMDWKRLMVRMEPHWEILLAHLTIFRFLYPGDREIIPKWVIEELSKRQADQLHISSPVGKVCRGRLLSPKDFNVDYKLWGYTYESLVI